MTPPQGRELGEWPGCPRRTDRAGVFSRPFQLSSATQELGQEGLASAWALAPRAVTATNLGQQMSKPKVSVAASSRSRLPKPPAAAVQPKRRPPDEGQKAAEAIHLLSSPGPLPKSGDAVPVTTIPVPSPLPIVLRGGDASVQGSPILVLGDLLLHHLSLGHCPQGTDNTRSQDASL